MTNEEAVKELMMAYEDLKNMCYMDCGREAAFNKAREALKAEPCEDAVSREHLLSEIDNLMQSPWFNSGKDDDMFTHYGYVERKEAVEIVRDLCVKEEPPITPKQRTGHWVGIDEEPSETWECDRCGFVVDAEGCIDPVEYRDMYKYCPNCGAKMEGESE